MKRRVCRNLCALALVGLIARTAVRAADHPFSMNGHSFDYFVPDLDDKNEEKQNLALMVFRMLGEELKRESQSKALKESSTESTVEDYCKEHPEFFQKLLSLLESTKPHVRAQAAWALTCRGRNGAEAVPKLLARINDDKEEGWVRVEAALALNEIKTDKEILAALLRRLLDSHDKHARYAGVELAGRMGAEAQAAAPRIVELIHDADPNVRLSAMENLGRIHPDPAVAVPVLVKELQGLNGTMFAANGLGLMGPDAKEAVPALIRALQYEDDNTRGDAARALGQIKANARDVVPALMALMKDKRVDVRASAATALGEFGPEAAAAIPILNDAFLHDPAGMSVTQYAHEALGKIGPALPGGAKNGDPLKTKEEEATWQGRSLSQWSELFKKREKEWDDRAAKALTHFGEAGYQRLGDTLLEGGEDYGAALSALGSNEGTAELAIKQLVRGLAAKNVVARRFVAQGIGDWGAKAKAAVPALIGALKADEDIPVRFWAAQALGKIGPDSKDAVPLLVQALGHADENMRRYALCALGEIGPDSKAAVPVLLERFKALDDFDRCHIAMVLGKIGADSPEVLPFLISALNDKGHNTRAFAAGGLGELGAKAASAVPDLRTLLEKDSLDHVRGYAAEALGKIGGGASSAVPALVESVFTIKDTEARGKVLTALIAIDTSAKSVLPGLEKMLASPNVYIRIQTMETIGKLGKSAVSLVPMLKQALEYPKQGHDGEVTVRLLAVQALQKMGNTPDVIAALKVALDDKDSTVKRVAKEALEKVGR